MQWYGRANPLSAQASSILHAMLQTNGAERPSAQQCLQHPFLARGVLPKSPSANDIVESLIGPEATAGQPTYRAAAKARAGAVKGGIKNLQELVGDAASSYYLRRARSAPDLKDFLEEAVEEWKAKGPLTAADLPMLAEHLPASHLLLADLGLP